MNKPKAKGTDSLSQIQISNPSLQPADKNHGYFQGIYFNLTLFGLREIIF